MLSIYRLKNAVSAYNSGLSVALTRETAVVILFPPDAPMTSCTSPLSSVKMAGDMDENGRFPGSGKLKGDGEIPSTFSHSGMSKSAMSSL